jgi:L-rhamnose-H+ transport protein
MLAGVAISAVAGRWKEARVAAGRAAGSAEGAPSAAPSGSYAKGLTLCILSGFFNPMLNFAITFSEPIKDAAKAVHASDGAASDAVWVITLLGGFVSNAVYCSLLLTRNRTWRSYRATGTRSHWFFAILMGAWWTLSLPIYGRALPLLGELQNSVGWAITMGCCIVASNIWGILSGEWRDGKGRPLNTMYAALAVILAAIIVIGYGNSLSTK